MSLLRNRYFTGKTLLILIMLFSFYPYVFCNLLSIDAESLLLVFYTLLFALVYVNRKVKVKMPSIIIAMLAVQLITWVLYFFIHQDGSYMTRGLFIVLTFFSLSILLSDGSIVRFTKCHNGIIATMAIVGIPAFFLYALGVIHPISYFENIDGREAAFFGLTCSNAFSAGICRVAGFFDEPGALAFWGIYALVINKLFFNNRKVEICLVVGLLTTLSAAYFVQLFLYLLLFYSRNIKQFLLFLIILIAVGYVTISQIGGNEQLAYMTTERFEDGQIRSDRNEMTKETKKIFAESPMVGIGAKKLRQIGYFDDNPYEIPAKDGIIGFFTTYLPLLVLLIRYGRKQRNLVFGIMILFAGYMQRPFHINELHYFMLYLFTLMAYLKYEKGLINDGKYV